jgi:hypothetical protein
MRSLTKTQSDEVKRLVRARNGRLRARELVDVARDKGSVLHTCFTWDPTKAAEKCRLYEAQEILRVVTVVIEPRNHSPVEVRALVSLPSDRGRGGGVYRDITCVMNNKTQRQELLELALDELRALRSKYSTLNELSKIWHAIDKAAIK